MFNVWNLIVSLVESQGISKTGKKGKKNFVSSNKLLTSIKEKGPLENKQSYLQKFLRGMITAISYH